MSQVRVLAIDATRGTAMLFALLAHFAEAYVEPTGHFGLLFVLYRVAMVASPTFVLISGIVLGYLYRSQQDDFPKVKATLIGRALFLLTAARALIYLAHVPLAGGFLEAIDRGFVTDAIACSIIAGALLIRYLSPRRRLLLAAVCFILSWTAVVAWNPETPLTDALKRMFIGSPRGYSDTMLIDFPVIPWFSLYLVGTWIGERVAILYTPENRSRAAGFVLNTALGTAGGAILLLLVRKFFTLYIPQALSNPLSYHLFFQKLPPTLVYFLAYGAVALIILYLFMRFDSHPLVHMVAKITNILGQTSLFTFILQYYVYFTIFILLRLPYSPWWPAYFLASVAVVYFPSYAWYRRDLNRYLVIPYGWMYDRVKLLFARSQ